MIFFWISFVLFSVIVLDLFVQLSKQMIPSEVDPNLGMEDMLDDFLSFFIAGKTLFT